MERHYLGRLNYLEGLKSQALALERLQRGAASAVVLGLEHSSVVTLGVRGDFERDVVVPERILRSKGFELHHVKRGGQATLHSPGQLVIYPCLNLKSHGLGVREFVETMTVVAKSFFSGLGVRAESGLTEPGLFVGGKKIAAFGFQVSRGLTSHGIALNVTNELSDFDLIRTCGIDKQPMTRLKDLGVTADLPDLFSLWCEALKGELDRGQEYQVPPLDESLERPVL